MQFEIIAIRAVVSQERWLLYDARRSIMLRRLGGDRLNERYLWHGTCNESARSIASQGFLRQLRQHTVYGAGSYFSLHPDTALSYAVRRAQSRTEPAEQGLSIECSCILSRVLVGEYALGRSFMLSPPRTNEGPHDNQLHDSTVNSVLSPSVFVSYSDDQAFPEFVVQLRVQLNRGGSG
ncbi:MAG: hypothetical protein MHM6MM_004556 [Cercozoa sp. M6MM]